LKIFCKLMTKPSVFALATIGVSVAASGAGLKWR